jgi:hypothetical protein
VIERARVFLAEIPGGLGAYSDSAGALVLRKQIAAALEKRDGCPASPDELYLTVSILCWRMQFSSVEFLNFESRSYSNWLS